MPIVTHLRRGSFPQRYGPNGNRGALYGGHRLTVQDLRDLVREERDDRIRKLEKEGHA